MIKFSLTYAGYADCLHGQLGNPALVRPIPLLDGVLGFFSRDEFKLHSFHIEHFQSFSDWRSLRELLGEEIADKIGEIHLEVSPQELPKLSGLSEAELSTAMKESIICKGFEVDWRDDSEAAHKLCEIVDRWETGN
jgi:hypothetical protein